jgi:hypothetical protein
MFFPNRNQTLRIRTQRFRSVSPGILSKCYPPLPRRPRKSQRRGNPSFDQNVFDSHSQPRRKPFEAVHVGRVIHGRGEDFPRGVEHRVRGVVTASDVLKNDTAIPLRTAGKSGSTPITVLVARSNDTRARIIF